MWANRNPVTGQARVTGTALWPGISASFNDQDGGDIVSAPVNTLLEASNDPDVIANDYVTEVDYPKHGKRLKVHGTPRSSPISAPAGASRTLASGRGCRWSGARARGWRR